MKELLPIIVAVGTWGAHCRVYTVLCHCDNEAVVAVINKGTCKEKHLAHLMRCLFFIEAYHNITLVAEHVPGKANVEADAISQNNLSAFFSSNPQAHHLPESVDHAMLQCLTTVEPNWMSADWIGWFRSTFTKP